MGNCRSFIKKLYPGVHLGEDTPSSTHLRLFGKTDALLSPAAELIKNKYRLKDSPGADLWSLETDGCYTKQKTYNIFQHLISMTVNRYQYLFINFLAIYSFCLFFIQIYVILQQSQQNINRLINLLNHPVFSVSRRKFHISLNITTLRNNETRYLLFLFTLRNLVCTSCFQIFRSTFYIQLYFRLLYIYQEQMSRNPLGSQVYQQWVCLGKENLTENISLQSGFEFTLLLLLDWLSPKTRKKQFPFCLIYSWKETKRILAFPKGICAKVKTINSEFELDSPIRLSTPIFVTKHIQSLQLATRIRGYPYTIVTLLRRHW